MSSRQKEAKTSAASKRKAEEEVRVAKPRGAVPVAFVSARHEAGMVSRPGRGFSLGELTAAQLPFNLARRWGLRLDLRRRSTIGGNVASIKTWAAGARPARAEGEVKRLEGELVKVEKEVKKEVKKEAAKVRKEAKKVEREVAEKVEKPLRKRPSRKKAAPKKSD